MRSLSCCVCVCVWVQLFCSPRNPLTPRHGSLLPLIYPFSWIRVANSTRAQSRDQSRGTRTLIRRDTSDSYLPSLLLPSARLHRDVPLRKDRFQGSLLRRTGRRRSLEGLDRQSRIWYLDYKIKICEFKKIVRLLVVTVTGNSTATEKTFDIAYQQFLLLLIMQNSRHEPNVSFLQCVHLSLWSSNLWDFAYNSLTNNYFLWAGIIVF